MRTLRPYVSDQRVLDAIGATPRERFVAPAQRAHAYANAPLEIGCGQTISQPLVVARMCDLLALRQSDRVLDVGTGSGYHAAVLARLAATVFSVERHEQLARQAIENLRSAGVENVTVVIGDGGEGLPAQAPFDAINVGAAAWREPPQALEAQLALGGRLVIPVEDRGQRLVLVHRGKGGLSRRRLEPVRFVPLV